MTRHTSIDLPSPSPIHTHKHTHSPWFRARSIALANNSLHLCNHHHSYCSSGNIAQIRRKSNLQQYFWGETKLWGQHFCSSFWRGLNAEFENIVLKPTWKNIFSLKSRAWLPQLGFTRSYFRGLHCASIPQCTCRSLAGCALELTPLRVARGTVTLTFQCLRDALAIRK